MNERNKKCAGETNKKTPQKSILLKNPFIPLSTLKQQAEFVNTEQSLRQCFRNIMSITTSVTSDLKTRAKNIAVVQK